MTATPHDSLFKLAFSNPQYAAEFFRSVLPPVVVQHIDFRTLRVESTTFIDDKLRARYSDLLFRVQLAGRRAYLYLLFEHQSRPERFMCLRVLRYVIEIWSGYMNKNPRARHLPLVIPIVLHHGEDGWIEPVTLRDLYDAPPEVLDALRPFLPELSFLLDDLAPQSDSALRARALSALPKLVLWTFKNVRRGRDAIPAVRKVADLLRALLLARNGLDALCTLLRYIAEVSESSREDLQTLLDELMLPEASEALMTIAEKLRRESREETQRDNLIKLLRLRFGALPEPVLARIHRADLVQMDHWFERGATAQTLAAVFSDSR
jgi:predicted transposase/invertase (TIGR01784 family)